MATKLNVRKNVLHLTDDEKHELICAILKLKKKGIYNRYIAWHASAGRFHTPQGADRNAAHMGPAFLPWHREFLRRFEEDLQSVAPGINLPYWDWAADARLPDPRQSPLWAEDLMGGSGNPENNFVVEDGPFTQEHWETIDEDGNPDGGLRRNLGGSERASTLPTVRDVKEALKVDIYDSPPWNMTSEPSFRNQLEGFINGPQLHNRVHGWVGGHMGFVPIAPNDPVFFLHHANVDRIWAIWQIIHKKEPYLPQQKGPFGHNPTDPMYPWDTVPEEVMNHRKMGYLYDTEAKLLKTKKK